MTTQNTHAGRDYGQREEHLMEDTSTVRAHRCPHISDQSTLFAGTAGPEGTPLISCFECAGKSIYRQLVTGSIPHEIAQDLFLPLDENAETSLAFVKQFLYHLLSNLKSAIRRNASALSSADHITYAKPSPSKMVRWQRVRETRYAR
jgi:hypothetical protein